MKHESLGPPPENLKQQVLRSEPGPRRRVLFETPKFDPTQVIVEVEPVDERWLGQIPHLPLTHMIYPEELNNNK